jgi:hypothetical protein
MAGRGECLGELSSTVFGSSDKPFTVVIYEMAVIIMPRTDYWVKDGSKDSLKVITTVSTYSADGAWSTVGLVETAECAPSEGRARENKGDWMYKKERG